MGNFQTGGAGVQQCVDALAGQHFAALVVALTGFFAPALGNLFGFGAQFGDLRGEGVAIGDEVLAVAVEAAGDHSHGRLLTLSGFR